MIEAILAVIVAAVGSYVWGAHRANMAMVRKTKAHMADMMVERQKAQRAAEEKSDEELVDALTRRPDA